MHDASASAIGYLFQVRWALLALVRESKVRPDLALTLEILDDVAFEQQGSATELLQVKHHLQGAGQLGDMSVDVWKTIKVWIDSPVARRPDGPLLSLVTTSVASATSAMAKLRASDRDLANALQLLDNAAAGSTNDDTQAARDAWADLSPAERQGIVARIRLHDASPGIVEVDDLIRQELALSAPFGHEDPYFDRVFAWWEKVAVDLLVKRRDTVSAIDLKARLSDIRDFFRADDLPTMVALSDVDEEALQAEYGSQNFVAQLQWINANATALRKAVVDYHRAVTQTTKWLDDSLIGVHEIQEFEDTLVDEWQRAFADMKQDLGADATQEASAQAGLALFRALSASSSVTIRALYDEAFYARGKRHELADHGHVGWHPNFESMLEALIGEA